MKNHLKKNYIAQQIDKSLGSNRKLWEILNSVIFNAMRNNEEKIKQIAYNGKKLLTKIKYVKFSITIL